MARNLEREERIRDLKRELDYLSNSTLLNFYLDYKLEDFSYFTYKYSKTILDLIEEDSLSDEVLELEEEDKSDRVYRRVKSLFRELEKEEREEDLENLNSLERIEIISNEIDLNYLLVDIEERDIKRAIRKIEEESLFLFYSRTNGLEREKNLKELLDSLIFYLFYSRDFIRDKNKKVIRTTLRNKYKI